MATPLPAVPPPPGPAPDATPESRDPLADRAHAAALDPLPAPSVALTAVGRGLK